MVPERVRYGDEVEAEFQDGAMVYVPREAETCPDCGTDRGALHDTGCIWEQCPVCSQRLMSCGHFPWVVRQGNCHGCGDYVAYEVDDESTLRCTECQTAIARDDADVADWIEGTT
jgi:hypothetical protein